jgi:hypothetical protein
MANQRVLPRPRPPSPWRGAGPARLFTSTAPLPCSPSRLGVSPPGGRRRDSALAADEGRYLEVRLLARRHRPSASEMPLPVLKARKAAATRAASPSGCPASPVTRARARRLRSRTPLELGLPRPGHLRRLGYFRPGRQMQRGQVRSPEPPELTLAPAAFKRCPLSRLAGCCIPGQGHPDRQ